MEQGLGTTLSNGGFKEKAMKESKEHIWEVWESDRVGWYRKCLTCHAMEMTPSDDGFTYENGFDSKEICSAYK